VPAGADRPRVGCDLCLDDIDGYAMAGEHAQIASDRHYTGRDRVLGACDLSAATAGLALHVADPTQLFRDHVAIVVARAHAMPDDVTTARDQGAISIARKSGTLSAQGVASDHRLGDRAGYQLTS
jgi:hypothetical protein